MTRPRLAVLDAVAALAARRHRRRHRRRRRELPAVSHQAVYDCLRALTDAGLVRRIQPLGSVARYESRVGDNHHHVVCRSCGVIADVDCAVGDTPCLTASDAGGFVIDEAEVIYWGRCPDCAADAAPDHPNRRTDETGEGPTCPRARTRSSTPPSPRQAAGRAPTRTGGPTSSTCRSSTSTRPRATRWARTSTTARRSASLDVEALQQDVLAVMTDSQDWWPADFGHYGGLMIRLSWHAAGTYRIEDGRGGAGDGGQRFAPLNSWPDNANLDKARRLLWPVKQKYGSKISWADLLVYAGNVALESMGFETFGFGFGREDVWEPEEIFWGPEDTWLGDERYSGDRELAPRAGRGPDGPDLRQPRGPQRQPRPDRGGPRHPRDVPPDGDERRGDGRPDRRRPLLRQDPRRRRRATTSAPSPRAAPLESQGLGWQSTYGTGKGADAITSGLEVTWTPTPDPVGQRLLRQPLRPRVGAHQEPGRRPPVGGQGRRGDASPTPTTRSKKHRPTMLTTDLALREDPAYEKISRRFHENNDEFRLAFAKAWYKLLHRDMGPVTRYLGPWVAEPQLWQDPVPAVDHELVDDDRRRGPQAVAPRLRPVGLAAGLHRVGLGRELPPDRQARRRQRRPPAAGAPAQLGGQPARAAGRGAAGPRAGPAGVQRRRQSGGKRVSLADVIVLGGAPAVEQAARNAGHEVTVPFTPGRTDASQERHRRRVVRSLEPRADGFRNYLRAGEKLSPETLLVDRAYMLGPRRAGDDGPGGRPAGAGRQRRRVVVRRPHRPHRRADQRLLRQPAAPAAPSGRRRSRPRTSTRSATSRPVT